MRKTVILPRAKRSTSKKTRKRSVSSHSPEDYVKQVLNNRSGSDILITRQQYEDLKRGRGELAAAREEIGELKTEVEQFKRDRSQWESVRERLQSKIESLEGRLRLDSGHTQELTFQNAKLETELRSLQSLRSDYHSPTAIEVAAKSVEKCCKLLESDVLNLLSFAPNFPQKPQILKLLRDAGTCASDARHSLSDCHLSTDSVRDGLQVRESVGSLREYESAVEKMKEQARVIRERVRLLESDGNVKKVIEDYQARLDLLESEKTMLIDHVQTLQSTLSEQCLVIEHLKGIISSLAGPLSPVRQRAQDTSMRSLESLTFSPDPTVQSKLSSPFGLKSGNKPRDITMELEALDHDIEVLQCSLRKALDV